MYALETFCRDFSETFVSRATSCFLLIYWITISRKDLTRNHRTSYVIGSKERSVYLLVFQLFSVICAQLTHRTMESVRLIKVFRNIRYGWLFPPHLVNNWNYINYNEPTLSKFQATCFKQKMPAYYRTIPHTVSRR